MKIRATLLFLAALGLPFAVCRAAEAQEAGGLKIAVVMTQKLLISTEIGKGAATKLRAKKEEAQKELDRKAGEITELKKDLEKRLMVLKAEEKDKAREDFERRQRDGLRLKEDLERELQKEENKVLGEVNEFLSKVIVEYGKANGYDLIIDASAALYFSDTPDITDAVVAEADRAFK